VVSRAFQILSDADKKSRYDKFGGDPDNRFSSSGSAGPGASPFSGFARTPGRGPMYEDEISPEELFNRFFGGGGLGGGFGEYRGSSASGARLTLRQVVASVALNLSSTWVVDRVSEYIRWEEVDHEQDQETPQTRRRQGLERSCSCYLYCYFSSYHYYLRYFQDRVSQARKFDTTHLYRHTRCTESRHATRSTIF
jgi:curved DNA-binding protein CbpA